MTKEVHSKCLRLDPKKLKSRRGNSFFKHSKSGGNSKVHPTTQSVIFFSITFSVAGMKCKMLQRTYLFL